MPTKFVDTRKFLSETKFYEGYSRFIESENRYETWDEAVDRVIDMHENTYSGKGNESELIKNFKNNIVHGDFHLGNYLFRIENDILKLIVLDFGIITRYR